MPNVTLQTLKFPQLSGTYKIVNPAAEFSTNGLYSVGTYVTYQGSLYKCTTAVTSAGPWTGANNWEATTISASLRAHENQTSNPHGVTKSQVGLSQVANERQYSVNNKPPAANVTFSSNALEATNAAAAILEVNEKINTHTEDTSNPHGVTAAQVGAAVLSDIPTAYTSNPAMDGTASAGTSTKWARGDHVHPVDTSRAAASELSSHISNSSNPHGVTKSQVGLGNVADVLQYSASNKPPATNVTFSSTALEATTAQAAILEVNSNLSEHESDTTNPHGVTKSQVGLGSVANVLQYSASNKPTAADVTYNNSSSSLAATTAQAAIDELKTNQTNHENSTTNPHSVTKSQVGLGNVANVLQYSASNKPSATNVTYDNSSSSLAATTAQAAIDEVVSSVSSTNTNVSSIQSSVTSLVNERPVTISTGSFSSLPKTINNAAIKSTMVATKLVLSNPEAKSGDWTFTTSDGSVVISGQIVAPTSITELRLETQGTTVVAQ